MVTYKEGQRDRSGAKTWDVMGGVKNMKLGTVSFSGPEYGWGFKARPHTQILKEDMVMIVKFLERRDEQDKRDQLFMSDLTFHREELQDGDCFYDVMVPDKPESIGNIYLLNSHHSHTRNKPGQWMYEQEDSCVSLSSDDIICILNKLLELNLEALKDVNVANSDELDGTA